jgi:hypothetical protein
MTESTGDVRPIIPRISCRVETTAIVITKHTETVATTTFLLFRTRSSKNMVVTLSYVYYDYRAGIAFCQAFPIDEMSVSSVPRFVSHRSPP